MALSADQFKQILASLKSDAPDKGSFEKRSAPRVGLRTKIRIYLDRDESRGFDIWIRDLSANGIGFVNGAPLESGREFLIRFPIRGKHSLSVVYSVMHCKDLSKSQFFIGARMDRIDEQ
jgi:hypothetical protein